MRNLVTNAQSNVFGYTVPGYVNIEHYKFETRGRGHREKVEAKGETHPPLLFYWHHVLVQPRVTSLAVLNYLWGIISCPFRRAIPLLLLLDIDNMNPSFSALERLIAQPNSSRPSQSQCKALCTTPQ